MVNTVIILGCVCMNRLCQIQTSLDLGNILLMQFLNKYVKIITFLKRAPRFTV